MSIGQRLKILRNLLGKTQSEMASFLGVSFPTYRNWELGISEPSAGSLHVLLERGINIHWLLSGEGPVFLDEEREARVPEWVRDEEEAIRVPLVGDAEAGEGVEYFQPARVEKYLEILPSSLPDFIAERLRRHPEEYFAVRILSLSMLPTLQPGDVVLVRKGAFFPGDIVVVRREGSKHFVKRLRVTDENTYIFMSDNPKILPILPRPGDEILGRVTFIMSLTLPEDIPPEEQQIARLAQLGFSLRAIARRVGKSHESVRQILKRLRDQGLDLPDYTRAISRKKKKET